MEAPKHISTAAKIRIANTIRSFALNIIPPIPNQVYTQLNPVTLAFTSH